MFDDNVFPESGDTPIQFSMTLEEMIPIFGNHEDMFYVSYLD